MKKGLIQKSKVSKSPKVSVIIPLRQLTHYLIFENLPALKKQSYRNFEIIVLPNEHGQYDITLLKEYKNLRIIPTGKVTRPAEKRDIGVKHAKGEIIAFIDDDAYPSVDWIKNAVYLFLKKKVEAVCGPGVIPHQPLFWEHACNEVLISPFGSGSFAYRFTPQTRRYVLDYPSMNFFIRRNIFERIGGFNSLYWPGEDSKLCNDLIVKEKGRILYDPGVLVYHHRRNSLKRYIQQHGQYGFHRGAFFAHKDKNSLEIAYLLPTAFIIYLFFLAVTTSAYLFNIHVISLQIAVLPLAGYALLICIFLVKSLIKSKQILVSFAAAMTLVATHGVYGTMFVKGFVKGLRSDKHIYE